MVKAGIFLMTRLWPVMSGTDAWYWIVTSAGVATLLLGAWAAIFQQDLKGILAYSTISHLGLITLLLGLGRPLAAVAAIFHTINHATFKASLFMAAGVIDHETGTRDVRRLSGLMKPMPHTAALAIVASAAMAGVPLLNGFLSKEMFFAEAIDAQDSSIFARLLPFIAVFAGMFSVVYSLRFILQVFFGPPAKDLPRHPHEPPRWMRFPIEFLVLACVVVGVAPGISIGPWLASAVTGVLGAETPEYSLAIWHGFSLPFVMSIVALLGGIVLYHLLRKYLNSGLDAITTVRSPYGQRVFEFLYTRLAWRWPRALLGFLGTQRLQPQIYLILLFAFIAGLLPFRAATFRMAPVTFAGWDLAFAIAWIVGLVCAVCTAWMAKYHRLAALILMGGTGVVVCLTFVWLSAPDLALTQLLVEVVTTVLILLGLRWMPKRLESMRPVEPVAWTRRRHARDLTLAVAIGAGLATAAYAMMTRPIGDTVAAEFLARSYSEAGGTNVVNVILVDFRAFDTLGEITVLCIVALTVFAVLRRFRPAADTAEMPKQQRLAAARGSDPSVVGASQAALEEYMYVPRVIMHWLFPVISVIAVWILLRGHDAPGGGFAAGITMSIAFVLQYMARGARWVEDRLIIRPLRWISAGLVIAALAGITSWFFGFPFLTTTFRYAELPVFGSVPLASALLFDIGVFLLVIGATVLMLIALAHQSIRGRRAGVATDTAVGEG
jgi:multicomponent K+:H+ antiporter subunit A